MRRDGYCRRVNCELRRNGGKRTARKYRRDASSTRCRETTGGTPAPLRRQHVFGASRRTRLSAGKMGAYIRFCETNPPIWKAFLCVSSLCKNTYAVCRRGLQVGSFWKTNPPGGVFGGGFMKSGVILGRKWVRFTSKLKRRTFKPLTLILCRIRQRVCRGSTACGVSRTRLVQPGSPGGERRWLRGAAAASIATEVSLPRSGPKRIQSEWPQELVSQAGGFG